MRIPARLFVEPVTVETYSGQGAYTDAYAPAVTVLGHVSGGRRVSRLTDGEEVVAEQQVLLPNPARLADGSGTVDPSTVLTAESRITAGTVTGVVARVAEHRQPGTGVVVYVSGVLG